MPIGSQNRLHSLRPLIDGLVPRQSALLTEGCHRLNELIHLRIQQMLPVARLQILDLIRRRTRVPVLNRDLIRRPVNRQPQIIGLA